VKFDIGRGGPLCRSCDSPAVRGTLLSPDDMAFFLRLTPGKIGGGAPAFTRNEQIEKFISEYFAHHLAGYRTLRSGEIFRS